MSSPRRTFRRAVVVMTTRPRFSTLFALGVAVTAIVLLAAAVLLGRTSEPVGRTVLTVRLWDQQVATAYRQSFDAFTAANKQTKPIWGAITGVTLLALGGAMLFSAMVNFGIDRIAYRRLRNAPRLAPLIAAIGMIAEASTIPKPHHPSCSRVDRCTTANAIVSTTAASNAA